MMNKEYRPTLAQLRTFVTIAENKHFGTAASKLNISQPSLSQALVALEQGLGVQLIERSTRRVIITPAGEKLFPLAKATLDAADTFIAHAHGASGTLTGPLSLGIIPTIAPYILPQIFTKVREEYPNLELQIVEDQTHHLINQLRDGTIDCALLALPTNTAGLHEISLYTESFLMVVPADHSLAGRDDLVLENLKDVSLLLLDDGHCLRDQVVDLCRQADHNFLPTTYKETRVASLTTVLQLITAGMGATLIPESAEAIECSRTHVATASFAEGVTASREVGLAFRNSSIRTTDFELLGQLITRAFDDIRHQRPGIR
ncbi:hydrogen peroxide-inducible genes activator [Corynebacterium sp. ES2794-CONJ1]|uniref:hydrogen peroxide-inducible genes activator n=1 Tax=unclassified Corynebacterium TaxID=2624378 RepID=UPI00216A548C|nr:MULTISPECIES: hydrogen peroxide-inducible genes activator [unclassified Corynebacterium]MCS4489180.1 hydrogen peroxide-inducible genes activator [Corynebacterium sp. ES2775-CONJ]MCS4490993.1 hydrogen peroxide-inducible genes activator [Corynebacterium sp. ES2715-CONJ3]MCS4531126.1 hydrogen peroxide-inducible genes activator [Corynebacterium sp. ES2730-CONJ]MCU9518493.1 hydrogen peroxide-inducible genes activator [Corynebacterium sp. ES2794-CONJ1]